MHHKTEYEIIRADRLAEWKTSHTETPFVQFLCNSSFGAVASSSSCVDLPFIRTLGLTTEDQVEAFLEVYGVWLGAGSISIDGDVVIHVHNAAYFDSLVARLSDVLPRAPAGCSGLHIDSNSQCSISGKNWTQYFTSHSSDSLQRISSWVYKHLGGAHLRAVLRGLLSAAGQASASELGGEIVTRSESFRDEVQHIALKAGYTSHWRASEQASPEQQWNVAFSAAEDVSRPTLDCTQELTKSSMNGTVWCVSVPTPEQLIIVRRVTSRKSSHILSAARPVIVGNTAFSACLSVWDSYGKGWASWASFCDRVFTLKKDIQWADHALVCYIQAIASKYKRATLNMSRILYLLSHDWYGGPVIKAFSRFAEHMPLWVWVMWIPQLLSTLARPEGAAVKVILSKLARGYPQALYYTMRSFLIEQRDVRPPQPPQVQVAAPPAPAATSAQKEQNVKEEEKKQNVKEEEKKQKDDSAMTDVASGSATTTTAAGSTTSDADAALASTSNSGPVPSDLAKPIVAAPLAPLRGEAAATEGAAAGQEAGTAAAAASTAAATAAANASTTAGSTSTGPAAPPAEQKSEEQLKRERDEAERSPPSNPNQSVVWVEELVNILRRSHAILTNEIEKMLDEFTRRFKPDPEEELLSAVHALALKALKHPPAAMDLVPTPLQQTIERVCKKFFTSELIASQTQRKHIAFVQRYKESFERDFMPLLPGPPSQSSSGGASAPIVNPHFPKTFTDLIQRLKRWKTHLTYIVDGDGNMKQQMEKLSPYLARFQSWDIEIPGQFVHDREPDHTNHTLLQRFDTIVQLHHSHGFSNRRIAMMGDDGKPYYFLVQYQITHITRSDERMMQLYVLLNRLMRNYKETRKRHLVHHVPIVIPLSPRLRLYATDPGHVTLEDIYEESCQIRRVDSDKPLWVYKESLKNALLAAGGQHSSHDPNQSIIALNAARLKVYNDITSNIVPDSILSKFIHRTIPRSDEYFVFKQQLCAQLGLSGYLSYLMKIGERQLHRIAFFRQNGRLINSEFFPTYNESGIVESNEPVPFRLTRNLQQALSPTLIDGLFSSAIMSANSCLLANQDIIRNYLSLFIRDDLLSWHSARQGPIESDVRQRELEKAQREKVSMNTTMVLKRIHMLMPNQPHQPSAAERQAQQAAHHAAGHHGPAPNAASQPQPLNHKIHLLIKVATSKQKLSSMGPQWAPWF